MKRRGKFVWKQTNGAVYKTQSSMLMLFMVNFILIIYQYPLELVAWSLHGIYSCQLYRTSFAYTGLEIATLINILIEQDTRCLLKSTSYIFSTDLSAVSDEHCKRVSLTNIQNGIKGCFNLNMVITVGSYKRQIQCTRASVSNITEDITQSILYLFRHIPSKYKFSLNINVLFTNILFAFNINKYMYFKKLVHWNNSEQIFGISVFDFVQ